MFDWTYVSREIMRDGPIATSIIFDSKNVRHAPELERPELRFHRRPRVLIRPKPGFYIMRLRRGGPLVPALICQLCPMALPEPALIDGPAPQEWCRPRDRSPIYRATLDGKPVPVDLVWTARSLRPISEAEFRFRMGELRRWARSTGFMPEAAPRRKIDLAMVPSLY